MIERDGHVNLLRRWPRSIRQEKSYKEEMVRRPSSLLMAADHKPAVEGGTARPVHLNPRQPVHAMAQLQNLPSVAATDEMKEFIFQTIQQSFSSFANNANANGRGGPIRHVRASRGGRGRGGWGGWGTGANGTPLVPNFTTPPPPIPSSAGSAVPKSNETAVAVQSAMNSQSPEIGDKTDGYEDEDEKTLNRRIRKCESNLRQVYRRKARREGKPAPIVLQMSRHSGATLAYSKWGFCLMSSGVHRRHLDRSLRGVFGRHLLKGNMLKVKTKRDIVVWISGGRCPVERLPGAPDFITTDTYHAFNDAADCYVDIVYHKTGVSNMAVKYYAFCDQLQEIPLKLSNEWPLLGLRMMKQSDGSKILVLGYNQSNENDTKLAIDRYVEGTLTSPHKEDQDQDKEDSEGDAVFADSDASDYEVNSDENDESEVPPEEVDALLKMDAE